MKANPYIGPRPYGRGEGNFFGRDREGQELAWLILAEQAVLFYAQSGAGKTSLLNARVIPILEKKGMRVLPVARVGGSPPQGITLTPEHNIFVYSALLDLAAKTELPPETLLEHTLLSYLQTYDRRPATGDDHSPVPSPQSPLPTPYSPTLLILDQFEEIATTHRAQWEQAEGFFRQVREALDALPGLVVLFVLREDYVAELDPYIPLLPSALQARFRMTLPTRAQALEIVRGPAAQVKCPFTEEAAANLVTNLSRIKTSGSGESCGQYVEPVQLQVVCRQLWESLPDSVAADGEITWDEIKHYNVDDALTTFYESTLAQTCQATGMTERRLRRWFAEALITPEGRRGLALQGATETAGLPNEVVRVLESHYLIRSESRGGSRWYELSHDRLVEPVAQSNRAWEAARQTPLRTAARQWKDSQNEGLLYRDKMLAEAVTWAKANPDVVEDYENEFLQAGEKAQQARQKLRRLRNTMIVSLSVSLVIMIALTVWALTQSKIATSRQLSAQAQEIGVAKEGAVRSVLLATESMLRSPSAEAARSIYAGLDLLPDTPLFVNSEVTYTTWNTAASLDGKWLAATNLDKLWVLDTATWKVILQDKGDLTLAFSPDSRWLATGGMDHSIRLRNTTTWAVEAQLDHDDVVNAITFGQDNQWLAAMSTAGTLRIWQKTPDGWTETMTEVSGPSPQRLPNMAAERVTCDTERSVALRKDFEYALKRSVVVSPDGKRLAAIGRDDIVRVWETHTWRPIMNLEHDNTVLSVAFDPDGVWLVTAGRDNIAHIWNINTQTEAFSVTHQCNIYALAFSPDGQRLATASDDMTARLWTIPEGTPKSLLKHDGAVWALAFSPNGKWLATGSLDGTARLWEATTGREMKRMPKGLVWGLTFAPDNTWLATNMLSVWPITTQTITPRIEHQNAVVVTTFSPDGRWFAAASWDGTVSVWDTQGSLIPTLLKYDEPIGEQSVWSIAFSPNSQLLAAGCGDGYTRIWNVATGSLVTKLQQGQAWDKIMAVAWSPDGQCVVSGSRLTARVWDWGIADRQEITQAIATMNNGAQVQDLEFSRDGKWLATAGYDGTARVWDAATGQPVARFEHRGLYWNSSVWAIALSPDGTQLASAGEDWTARLWDLTAREVITEAIQWGYQAYVHDVAFSPDGWWLAVASMDGTVTIWSTKILTHRPLVTLDHEGDGVWTLAFSPDGQWLATGTRRGTARVWQVLTGKEVFRVQHSDVTGYRGGLDGLLYSNSLVTTVAFSPDGHWLASGGMNGTARIWNWRSEDIIAEACARLPRNLTRQEWKKYLPGRFYRPTCPDLPIPQE
ncbi:MAG TPA: hypothetical protein PKH77_15335 [Anaerolineae bacterium]|nr:hypothetical protein [Anaerolineae bacterium]